MKKYITSVLMLLVMTASAGAWATTSSSFKPFTLSGIHMSPTNIDMGTLTYNLTLNPGATLNNGVHTYIITNVWGFYAIGDDFTATGNKITVVKDTKTYEWKWNDNYTNGAMAGWVNADKKIAIKPGDPARTFTFTSLIADRHESPEVMMGLHISLDLAGQSSPFDGGGNTGDVYSSQVVPEASTLIGFGSALAMTGPGMTGWLRRRRA